MATKKTLRRKNKSKSSDAWFKQLLSDLKQDIKHLILIVLFVVFVLPPLYILLLNFINPPITPLMVKRSLQDYKHRHEWTHAPKRMRFAVVASEDNNFCSHNGFDFGALRLVIGEAIKGRSTAGASTISMQTSKNLFLLPNRSMVRKVLEAYYTVWLEVLLSKRRIMQIYLNIIEFGQGVYGIEAASHYYFKIPAKSLSSRQAAQLASILPSPLRWSPQTNIARSRIIERRVRQMGSLTSCVN